jgi:hypothetical protein
VTSKLGQRQTLLVLLRWMYLLPEDSVSALLKLQRDSTKKNRLFKENWVILNKEIEKRGQWYFGQ